MMRRLRQRAVKVLVSRYTAAAAAVMIAGTLWYSGVLTGAAEAFATRPPGGAPTAAGRDRHRGAQNTPRMR